MTTTNSQWTGGRLPVVFGSLPLPGANTTGISLPILRDFLEGALLSDSLAQREIKIAPSDPTWANYCLYLSALAEAGLKSGELAAQWPGVPEALARGGILTDFSYVGINTSGFGRSLVEPQSDLWILAECLAIYGLPSDRGKRVDSKKLLARIQAPPGRVLELTWQQDQKENTLLLCESILLDDGRTKSWVGEAHGARTLEQHSDESRVQAIIWQRLLRDSLHGIGPRPLKAGALQIEAEPLLEQLLGHCLSGQDWMLDEQLYFITAAALRGLWPAWVLDRVSDSLNVRPEGPAAFMRVGKHLPPELREKLPPGLEALLL